MLAKIDESTLFALERSPVLQAARKVIEDERRERRRALIERVNNSAKELNRSESEVLAKAAPLEKKLAALRAEITTVEAALVPLAQRRLAVMSASDEEIRRLRKELRSEVEREVEELKRAIEITRMEISANLTGQRLRLLNITLDTPATRPSHEKIVSVVALLLDAYREADRIAVEEADVGGALNKIRDLILRSGVRLVGSLQ